MRGMPFTPEGKGAPAVAATAEALWRSAAGFPPSSRRIQGVDSKEGYEPRSVLDHRRSPSPPTSTSTLSSSLGGGGGGVSFDTASVAAISENPPRKWPPSQGTSSSGAAEGVARKEEWASELQPIPPGLDSSLIGAEKCGPGMEDWDSVLSDPAVAAASSPGHDQSFLRWIMGDGDEAFAASLKQQNPHHMLPQAPLEFGGSDGGGGFGLVDTVFGFEAAAGTGGGTTGSLVASPATPFTGHPFLDNSGSAGDVSRILPIQPIHGGPLPGVNSNLVFSGPPPANGLPLPPSLPPGMIFQEPAGGEKPHLFGPNVFLNQQLTIPSQNPAFVLPMAPYSQAIHQQATLLSSHPKHHDSMVDPSCQIAPRFNPGHDLFLRRHQQSVESLHGSQPRPMRTKMPGDETPPPPPPPPQQQPQALVDQLFEAAELIESGNFVNAREILARLNHQLSPIGKPLLRSAFYCKEALQSIIYEHSAGISPSSPPPLRRNPSTSAPSSPLDVVLKLSAYKAFSEISPLLQFAHFTCAQALLEELSGCDRIHIIDFDIGVGGQWSSFMQELAQRRCAGAGSATPPSLRLTAFAPLSSLHPFELGLTREHLSHFASDLNIPFEFNILSVDSFDPAALLSTSRGGEAIAVNLPACSLHPSAPGLVRLVKQLSPKIVVCVEHGWDHSGFAFARHFLHVLQSTAVLLDSIDAACGNPEVVGKIERYLLQPRIQNSIAGRRAAAEKAAPPWNLFASAGLAPLPLSNFAETQAECLMKRIQVRGFHVEKRQAALLLCWQRGGIASVSAWSC